MGFTKKIKHNLTRTTKPHYNLSMEITDTKENQVTNTTLFTGNARVSESRELQMKQHADNTFTVTLIAFDDEWVGPTYTLLITTDSFQKAEKFMLGYCDLCDQTDTKDNAFAGI